MLSENRCTEVVLRTLNEIPLINDITNIREIFLSENRDFELFQALTFPSAEVRFQGRELAAAGFHESEWLKSISTQSVNEPHLAINLLTRASKCKLMKGKITVLVTCLWSLIIEKQNGFSGELFQENVPSQLKPLEFV